MENTINTLDVITAVHHSLADANCYLTESPSDRFNRTVLEMIQQEIENSKQAASHWKYMNPSTHAYTHTAEFPMAIYNELSEEFLIQLEETSGISIYAESEKRAIIRIILHF